MDYRYKMEKTANPGNIPEARTAAENFFKINSDGGISNANQGNSTIAGSNTGTDGIAGGWLRNNSNAYCATRSSQN
jgi:hypothetical protein